jgi:hypothetical protein
MTFQIRVESVAYGQGAAHVWQALRYKGSEGRRSVACFWLPMDKGSQAKGLVESLAKEGRTPPLPSTLVAATCLQCVSICHQVIRDSSHYCEYDM